MHLTVVCFSLFPTIVSSYFWSKTLVELPRTLAANLLFGSILYPSIGLRWGAEYFFLFIVAVLLVTLAAESTAYLSMSTLGL